MGVTIVGASGTAGALSAGTGTGVSGNRRSRTAFTTACAISSCISKTSVSWRSKVSDQRLNPSETLISCTETRTRSPTLRTLPSRTLETFSSRPISVKLALRFLKLKDAVRPAVCSFGMRASRPSNSSVKPSQKYSWSLAGLRSAKGSTAMDAALLLVWEAMGKPRGVVIDTVMAGVSVTCASIQRITSAPLATRPAGSLASIASSSSCTKDTAGGNRGTGDIKCCMPIAQPSAPW